MIKSSYLEDSMTPDIIDDTNPNDIYLGYYKYNSLESPYYCLIKRVTKETVNGKIITKIRYPYGRFEWFYQWSSRYLITDWRHRDFLSDFNEILFGYLYNYWAAKDARNISNAGFHVPVRAEYETLAATIGGGLYQGGKLKEASFLSWNSPNTGATNEVSFNIKGSGYRDRLGNFNGLKLAAMLMTLTLNDNPDNAMIFALTHDGINFYAGQNINYSGYSLRLIADNTTLVNGQKGKYIGNDGKIYPTICIGTQEWLAVNLAETKYRTGANITKVTESSAWDGLLTEGYCAYNNDEIYV